MIQIYLGQPKYKLNTSFISEIITLFLQAVRKIKDPVLSKFVADIYGKLLKIAPKGIITKFEKNSRSLIQELVGKNITKIFEERMMIYNLLVKLIKNEKYIVFKEIRKTGSIPLFNKILNEKGET